MKNNWCLNILVLLFLGWGAESSMAQGLVFSKKDGTQFKVPYEQLDCVTVYDAEKPNFGETVLPVHFKKKLMGYCAKYESDAYSKIDSLSFQYDDQGRILSERCKSSEGYLSSSPYSWKGNQITYVSGDGSDLEDGTYTIENGKVVSYKGSYVNIVYTYNDLGQLVSYQDKDEYEGCEYNLIWEGDKLVSYEMDYLGDAGKSVNVIEYTDQKCEGVCLPLYEPFSFSKEFILVHPCFMGKLLNQLPSRMIYKGGDGSSGETKFNFELDNDGFVTKADVVEEFSFVTSDGSVTHRTYHTVFEYNWK